MPKTKEALAPILYDHSKPQAIPLNLEKNGRTYRVVHHLEPCSNERFFQLQEEALKAVERGMKKATTSIIDPQHKLWKDLATKIEGYAEKADWKSQTHVNDGVAAVAGMLHVVIVPDDEVEPVGDSELYDDEAPTIVVYQAMQSGALLTLSCSFREETKAERDEFVAIEANQPNPNGIASAEKLCRAERLYLLGKKVLVSSEGYEPGTEIPCWHLAAATDAHFNRVAERLGKFSIR